MELFSIRIQRTFQLVSTHLESLHEFCRSILITFAFRSQIVLEVRNEHMADFLQ